MAETATPPVDDFDDGETPQPNSNQPVAFDSWLNEQPDDIKGLISTHTANLKSALESERSSRRELEKQIKRIARTSEEGSELRQQLDRISGELSTTSQRADFYDEAHKQGVKNLRLSYLAAKEAGLVDDRGRCDFGQLKTQFPELFAEVRKQAPTNTGAGAGTPPTPAQTMNDIIRGRMRR